MLRRVLNLECQRPVPVGTVIEIQGAVLHRAQAYLVTGLLGAPLEEGQPPWLEALLGFAQVDEAGPTPCPKRPAPARCRTRKPGNACGSGWTSCSACADLLRLPATVRAMQTLASRARRLEEALATIRAELALVLHRWLFVPADSYRCLRDGEEGRSQFWSPSWLVSLSGEMPTGESSRCFPFPARSGC